jgi:chondroitin 4-sulfotransferase 11
MRPYFFISVPKTGSVSMHRMLKDGMAHNHMPAWVVRQSRAVAWKDAYTFAVVRNPWDRAVSWFFGHRNLAIYNRRTFKEWVKAGLPHHWEVPFHPLHQHEFICWPSSGEVMVDFVGRFEQLPAVAKHVRGVIGLTPRKLPHVNKSKHADYRSHYNSETERIVREFAGRDLELFNDYEF